MKPKLQQEAAEGAESLFSVSSVSSCSIPFLLSCWSAAFAHEVRREWANARRLEGNEKFYQELLKRYVVTIEHPKPASEQKKLAETK